MEFIDILIMILPIISLIIGILIGIAIGKDSVNKKSVKGTIDINDTECTVKVLLNSYELVTTDKKIAILDINHSQN